MAVLDPVLLVINGLAEATEKIVSNDNPIIWDVPDFPFDPSRGTHTVPMTNRIFVDRSDVRLVDSEVSIIFISISFLSINYFFRISLDLLQERLLV